MFYLTEAPAVCNGNPGSLLSVCSAARPVDSLKTKQSSKWRVSWHRGQEVRNKVLAQPFITSKHLSCFLCTWTRTLNPCQSPDGCCVTSWLWPLSVTGSVNKWLPHSGVAQPSPHLCSCPLERVRWERGTSVWGSGRTVMSPQWLDTWRPVLTGTGPAGIVKWYPVSIKTQRHTLHPLHIQWCTFSSRRLLMSAAAVL